jgi:hypothetical protein
MDNPTPGLPDGAPTGTECAPSFPPVHFHSLCRGRDKDCGGSHSFRTACGSKERLRQLEIQTGWLACQRSAQRPACLTERQQRQNVHPPSHRSTSTIFVAAATKIVGDFSHSAPPTGPKRNCGSLTSRQTGWPVHGGTSRGAPAGTGCAPSFQPVRSHNLCCFRDKDCGEFHSFRAAYGSKEELRWLEIQEGWLTLSMDNPPPGLSDGAPAGTGCAPSFPPVRFHNLCRGHDKDCGRFQSFRAACGSKEGVRQLEIQAG